MLTLRQSRLAQAVEQVLGVFLVLVDCGGFPSVDCKSRLDAPHFVGCGPGFRELPDLGVSRSQPEFNDAKIGHPPRAFPQWGYRLRVTIQHVMRVADVAEPAGILERIKTKISLQNIPSASGLTRKHQAEAEASIGKIGIE